jgi:hypothetical protein
MLRQAKLQGYMKGARSIPNRVRKTVIWNRVTPVVNHLLCVVAHTMDCD